MKRNAYIVLVAALAWATVAIVLGAGSFSGARPALLLSGVSPTCLPASLDRSASLPGVGIDVSPAPDTDTASPETQISFLGRPASDIRDVSVEGSRSGRHSGHLSSYSQGDGASFVPDKPFQGGERVLVRALVGPAEAPQIAYGFRVAVPYPSTAIPSFPNPPAPPADYQSFISAPDLHPPVLSVTSPDRDPAAGEVLMTVGPGPGQYGPLIYTSQGRLVWFQALPHGVDAENLGVQDYAGQQDLTWWRGRVLASGFGLGEDIVMDQHYQTVATIRAGNGYEADLHDFQIVPGDVAYITVYDPLWCNLSAVGGQRNGSLIDTAVQAIDMKTGLVRWEWHSLDHVGVDESHAPLPSGRLPWDWFHLNSVDVEPNGDLLISARSTWTVYRLQRGSGTIAWRLGGTHSSFRMGPGTETAWQHDARLQSDGTITLFDNGSTPQVHDQSRGVRVALDEARHTARLVRDYRHPGAPLLADSQGNMQLRPDGSLVVGWGAVPSVTELAGDGRLLFDAHMAPGMSSYRAFRFPWSGHPLTSPSVSARLLVAGDATAVFASWNGASDVASWRVFAGTSPAWLSTRATVPASAFESSVTLPAAYAYVSVQALSASGALLGASPAVKVQSPHP
jgi:Arylsulfotransferase (ASST)